MKKEKDEISKRVYKKKIRIQLMQNLENNDDNSKIFGNTFTSNFHTNNKNSNNLFDLKLKKIKMPKNFKLTNQSAFIKDSINNNINISTGYDTNRNNRHKKNENKISSSFYVTKEDKNNRNKKAIKGNKTMIINLSLNDNIKKRNINKKEILVNSFTYRNNINTKEKNKIIFNKKQIVKESENKINKFEKQNKNHNQINKFNNNEITRKNKFERTKTVTQFKNQKKEENKKSIEKSMNKKEKNVNEKKPYNNLYDKYIDKFKEKIKKISLNQNNKINENEKNNQPSKSIPKKEMIKKYATQNNFFKRNMNNKAKENIKEKIIKEAPKKQITTKTRIEKRKVGKSVCVKRDKDKDKNANQEKDLIPKNKDKKDKKTRNDNGINIPRRSKSMAKLTDNTKKNFNNEKYDIDYILYGKIKPSKYEDPFDDIDSIVRHIDFNRVKLNSKNIFDVEGNDKYENYSKNFDNLFNKDLSNHLRKSIEKDKSNEKNDNNANLIQNENTTDSFKKNKINVSFIENQNN